MKKLFLILAFAGMALAGYHKYQARAEVDAPPVDAAPVGAPLDAAPATAVSSPFKCDGRTHCSQMTSCAEATYFIQHCPNTSMDGNNDGVPCERQWCSETME